MVVQTYMSYESHRLDCDGKDHEGYDLMELTRYYVHDEGKEYCLWVCYKCHNIVLSETDYS